MDDLLALMGEDGPAAPTAAAPPSTTRSSSPVADGRSRRRQSESSLSSNHQTHHAPVSQSSEAAAVAKKRRRAEQSTLDPLTNLRITNRRTSRFDLSDALAPFEFVTSARLAAMSTRDLGRYIAQPSAGGGSGGFSFGAGPAPNANASDCFTGGKSNLATMGILFSNSGSKVSSNTGRAYSIFQLGDLSTGPAVSVFLFGDAYSKHTGNTNGSYSGRAGSVVAILAPNILPPKRGGATSVSLSVNNADQILTVGTAQDYATCSGMIRVRRDGSFVDTRCTKFVDKRCGLYCQAHKRQGLQQQVVDGNRMTSSSSSAGGLKKNGATFLQQFRGEGSSNSSGPNRRIPMASNASSAGTMTANQQGAMGRGGMQASSSLASALAAAGMDQGSTGSVGAASTNTMLQQHGGGKNSLLNAPRHMVKTSIPGTSRGGNTNATRAAAGAAKHKRPPLTRAGKDVFGDALLRGQMKSSGGNDRAATTRTSLVPRAKPKERKVATFGGYSGSVQVPQPSRSLFGDVPVSQHLASSSSIAVTPSLNPAEVRERQRQVAEQMRKRKHGSSIDKASGGGVTNPYLNKGAPAKPSTSGRIGGSTQGRMDDIFAGLEDLDRADAIAAKSSYQSEADAEQYARSRQAVNDLEGKETRDERKKKQMKGRDEKVIQVQWICTSCGKESASQLVICQKMGHKVKKKRAINKRSTKEESRDRLNKKRAEDGGLQLGSGLEWSGFRGA